MNSEQIKDQVSDYIRRGGVINIIPRGVSGIKVKPMNEKIPIKSRSTIESHKKSILSYISKNPGAIRSQIGRDVGINGRYVQKIMEDLEASKQIEGYTEEGGRIVKYRALK